MLERRVIKRPRPDLGSACVSRLLSLRPDHVTLFVTVPILSAPLQAPDMGEHAGEPEKTEYLVRVRWQKTVPKEQAIWEKGMFANQNSACRLRNQFTLDRLIERFGLGE